MTKKVVTVQPQASLAEVERVFQEKSLRRIPVVQGKQVIGIVSNEDLVRAKPSLLDPIGESAIAERSAQISVESIMTRNPVTVQSDIPVEDAAAQMRMHKISSIPVVDQGQLVGIITESNILDAFLEIIGANVNGDRIELKIEHKQEHFYQMIDVFREQGMHIRAITIYPHFSKEFQLVTVKVQGGPLDGLTDKLWHAGVKVNRILDNS
jgi:acetoin utilization protein AcuB